MGQNRQTGKKLGENHPLAIKTKKLMEFMYENDIQLSHKYYGLIITDNTEDGISADIVEVDNNEGADTFPFMEYKLVPHES